MLLTSIIAILLFSGCALFDRDKKQTKPPQVTTTEVTRTLEETRQELVEAGVSNKVIEQKIDTAISLTARLEKLLEFIEKEKEIIGAN